MLIINQIQPGIALAPTAIKPNIASWKVGQVIQAMVIAPTISGRATLEVGGTRLEAATSLPLSTGEILTAKVEKQGTQAALRVLNRTAQSGQAVQAKAMGEALPNQRPLPPLLANLNALATQAERAHAMIPRQWLQLARNIVNSMPEVKTVSRPDGLQRAIANSGTFFESRVAATLSTPSNFPINDLKAGLLRLHALILQLSASGQKSLDSQPLRPSGSLPDGSAQPPAQPQRGTPRQPLDGRLLKPAIDLGSQATQPTNTHPAKPTQKTHTAPQQTTYSDPSKQPLDKAAVELRAQAGRQGPPMRGSSPQAQGNTPPSLAFLPVDKAAAELRAQADGGVMRIQLNQLNSLAAEEGMRPGVSTEIPVRREGGMDVWSVRIEQDGAHGNGEDNATTWSVTLGFYLANLGPMHVRVLLHGGQISTNFWSERPETEQLVETHSQELRRQLVESGLNVGEIHSFQGHPPAPATPDKPSEIINLQA